MPIFALQLQAQLENITSLKPESDDFAWCMKLKCDSCGEETADFVYIILTETYPVPGSRSEANLVFKCKLCRRENSINIIPDSLTPYSADDSGAFKTIVKFECRGVTPTEFLAGAGWVAEGTESQTPFSIDLTEKEWFDYDEKAAQPVSISDLQFQFVHVKQ